MKIKKNKKIRKFSINNKINLKDVGKIYLKTNQ